VAVTLVALVAAMATLTACGGDDSDSSGDDGGTENADERLAAPTVTDAATDDTEGSNDAEESADSEDVDANGADSCPSESSVSDAVGRPMVFDGGAPVQASGFCPYTDSTGDVSISVTFTNLNMTSERYPEQEDIDGVGEAALWTEGSGELVAWTGEDSVIVSIIVFGGQDIDERAVAIAVAQTAISGG